MANATVAADLGQPLDIQRHVAAQVTLHGVIPGDLFAQSRFLLLGQVLHPRVGVNARGGEDLVGAGAPNAENVGETDLYPLVLRQVNTGNTCHFLLHLPLTLSLLVLGVFANDHNFALALDDLALLAHGLHGRSDFH